MRGRHVKLTGKQSRDLLNEGRTTLEVKSYPFAARLSGAHLFRMGRALRCINEAFSQCHQMEGMHRSGTNTYDLRKIIEGTVTSTHAIYVIYHSIEGVASSLSCGAWENPVQKIKHPPSPTPTHFLHCRFIWA
jgi:hypothetical protein